MYLTLFMLWELLLCLLPVVEAPHCEGDFSLLAESEQPFGSCSVAIETKNSFAWDTECQPLMLLEPTALT